MLHKICEDMQSEIISYLNPREVMHLYKSCIQYRQIITSLHLFRHFSFKSKWCPSVEVLEWFRYHEFRLIIEHDRAFTRMMFDIDIETIYGERSKEYYSNAYNIHSPIYVPFYHWQDTNAKPERAKLRKLVEPTMKQKYSKQKQKQNTLIQNKNNKIKSQKQKRFY